MKIKAWHFIDEDRRLGYGDGREVKAGVTHKVDCEPELCRRGLHASIRAIDALEYGGGSVVSRVEVSGKIVKGKNKLVGTERTYLWVADATDVINEFLFWLALKYAHIYNMPDVIINYLETRDESLRREAHREAGHSYSCFKGVLFGETCIRKALMCITGDIFWMRPATIVWFMESKVCTDADNDKLTFMLNELKP